jgi:UDP-N-acetylglucosamine 2-epimerase (non-hydrolysing)/GDP/UDP-N,N'-diacetylbacillosamine 2-epimerase (hydrolysing)
LPVIKSIDADPDLVLRVFATGMHLSPEFGHTVDAFAHDGITVDEKVASLLSTDSPAGIANSIAVGVLGFSQVFSSARPDILVVTGDRFEMYAAAVASLPYRLPVAHIHGGEVTHGAIDDALRHSITKLSHLHFVSTREYARRVEQLGEEPWRITVSGAPALDALKTIGYLQPSELLSAYGIATDPPPLLVTYHPVTLEYDQTDWQVEQLLGALDRQVYPIVFTLPNADTSGRKIALLIREFVRSHPGSVLVDNLGTQAYFTLMRSAVAMVGNSSSGIVEAASFSLPVLNIGSRQGGRVRGRNVVDVGNEREEISRGLDRVLDPAFRAGLERLANPYGDGRATEHIVDRLKSFPLGDRGLVKRFFDIPSISQDEQASEQ